MAEQTSQEGRFQTLLSWATTNGAQLHPNIEISQDPATGAGFTVKAEPPGLQVSSGETVVTCPMPITLSYLNALSNPPPGFRQEPEEARFPSEFLSGAPPHVIGRFFLVKQYLLGRDSFWWPYIQALPQPDLPSEWLIPPFWPEADAAYLNGTNLEVSIHEIRTTLGAEYEEATKLLAGWPGADEYTPDLYHWAYAIYTSRSFMPTLVVPDITAKDHATGIDWDSFSILLPLFDIGNHDMTALTSWKTDREAQSCELLTFNVKPYTSGCQVFNNYGVKTNAKLLLAYGFTLEETPTLQNDYVHVRKRVVHDPSAAGPLPPAPEYLFSLRPMMDPRSYVGGVSQHAYRDLGPRLFPAFRHIQASMVLDILEQILNNNAAFRDPEIPTTEDYLRKVLVADLSRDKAAVLQIILATVQQKALQELDKLDENEPMPSEDEELSQNQLLALNFRNQCRSVLHNVMDSIQESTEDDRFISIMGPE
ncbi:unnamed protein product [Parascedosporium putredinis]|uniref:SET domain-containing protein n=1 Tax=Parascedosporium putredinis TaxID=1442378 RepID=A0A9P1HCQ5_9PEZI|nr:unnamed protein product [Parascedosporium putredinis]CAI8004069.1 unnamed protein product [Parascedosporium putredinis]